MNEWTEVECVPCKIHLQNFLQGISVWIRRPHVANRRLVGASLNYSRILKGELPPLQKVLEFTKICNATKANIVPKDVDEFALQAGFQILDTTSDHSLVTDDITAEVVTSKCIKDTESIKNQEYEEILSVALTSELPLLMLRTLVPKRVSHYSSILEVVVIDPSRSTVSFYPAEQCSFSPSQPYAFQLTANSIQLSKLSQGPQDSNLQWMATNAVPKLVNWANNCHKATDARTSLRLLPIDAYNKTYQDLKHRYAQYFIKIWPEKSDPLKFVHEDVGIAAYLLTLWADDNVCFLDLGCGNGLLVHILCGEGVKGAGVDIRRRNIWDLYPPETVLQEATMNPTLHDFNLSFDALLPECELNKHIRPDQNKEDEKDEKPAKHPKIEKKQLWLIGNHSDELTPWIPVLAARLGCNFFLIPCCAYSFYSKFQRKNPKVTLYEEYIKFVEDISQRCGFCVERDCLRIPSTKRSCLIGKQKEEVDQKETLNQIEILTKSTSNFTPRAATEAVKNLTQMDVDLVERVICKVTSVLLEKVTKEGVWDPGVQISMREAVNLCDKEELRAMKQGAGGLQTLLKNHSYIFKVQGGIVQLRRPQAVDRDSLDPQSLKAKKFKTKPCWFLNHHPQGCPLSSDACSFVH